MKDSNIEDLLREGKPHVKDDPTFLLETRRRLSQVEGIKKEVDRERKRSRLVLVATLLAGLVVGMSAMVLVFFFPSLFESFENSFLVQARDLLLKWKVCFSIGVAAIAITLGLVLSSGSRGRLFER